MENKNKYLGIELGSTRIKAVAVDDTFKTCGSGDYTWKSNFENGIWTYDLNEAWTGIKAALANIKDFKDITSVGVSGMMHGYLAFDENWNLLVPFRTWQNTVTARAADILTNEFNFNIPQRWSIAHLYEAILNGEEHIGKVAHITTLAGYIHYSLTGVNAVGIGEASGIFPIDNNKGYYNEDMLDKFNALAAKSGFNKNIRDILPEVMSAGENAGCLTAEGAKLIDNLLDAGVPFVPCEGDAGTGMTATNAISPGTGNVSAGTSIFAMIVLSKPLSKVYKEIDIVSTPSGNDVAMVHANNCTNDINAWISVFSEMLSHFGIDVNTSDLFEKLYTKSLEGDSDCGGVTVYNYLAGEHITHLDEGRPMVIRDANSNFNLANFIRSQLYATMATLKIGMEILQKENVTVNSLIGHGGLFKVPGVCQKYLAGAFSVNVTCMATASEGGPYGMALLAAYSQYKDKYSLSDFLNKFAFGAVEKTTLSPEKEVVEGFNKYIEKYKSGLVVESSAIENM